MRKVAITTTDNPFDPFDQFDKWFHFDSSKNYHSSRMVARIAFTSSELPDADNTRIIEDAIDYVVSINPTGNMKKLVRS